MSVIGYAALFLALASSLYAAGAYIIGARGKHPSLVASARSVLLLSGGLITLAVLLLLAALLSHNFRIEYVAAYSSQSTPLAYLVTALWAGNDGSLLFWVWLLSIFAVIVVLQRRDDNRELVPYASAVIMIVQAFFLLLLVSVASPFSQLPFAPADGRGLNPMLENPGMILHPPALLVGYVGFTVAFAFAIAALWSRRLGSDWLTAVRRWTLFSWLLLGVGNIIGAWWAYVELGWGGYWAWDPVENAGLMPWLLATAFLHSIMIQRRKGMLRVWSMVLIILTFNLAIFGTFITRSGVLSSVHTYGESSIGPFFLIFLIIALLGSLGLLYYRREELRGGEEIEDLVSSESSFLLNNILLVGAAFVIFVGTVFPGITEAIRGVRIEVGKSFFNQVNGPIFLAIILLVGLCTLIGWRKTLLRKLGRDLLWPLGIAVVLAVVLLILGVRQWQALAASFICSLVFWVILYRWLQDARNAKQSEKGNYFQTFWRLLSGNRTRYGGYLVHLAVVIMAVGVIGSSIYDVEKEASLRQGETLTIKGYNLVFQGLQLQETPDKQVVTASLLVYHGDRYIGTMKPEKYFHRSFEQPVTEVAIYANALEDLYVILAGWDDTGTAAFTVLVNPLVAWLWVGGGVFLLGGVVAFWPDRGRLPAPAPRAPSAGTGDALEEEIERQIRQRRQSRARFCSQCGARIKPGNRFCGSCGSPLGKGGEGD
ncbi:MAG: cytochrome c-type biogenesis CcmF C-terminal domain-containing protein [Chloroflexota bacterium]